VRDRQTLAIEDARHRAVLGITVIGAILLGVVTRVPLLVLLVGRMGRVALFKRRLQTPVG
jgi:hypothetical protein